MYTFTARDARQEYVLLKTERGAFDAAQNNLSYWLAPSGEALLFGSDQASVGRLNAKYLELSRRRPRKFSDLGSTATRTLSNFIHASLISDEFRWFEMAPPPGVVELAETEEEKRQVQLYAMATNETLFHNLVISNFSSQMQTFLHSLVMRGTAVMTEEDPAWGDSEVGRDGKLTHWAGGPSLYFRNVPLNDFYFTETDDERPAHCYRRCYYTLAQMAEKFGPEALPEEMRQRWTNGTAEDKSSNSVYEVVHAVYHAYRNPYRADPAFRSMPPAQRPWKSGWFIYDQAKGDSDQDEWLQPQTHHECPYFIARWRKEAGIRWGFGVGQEALASIRSVNELWRLVMQSAALSAQPPLKTTQMGITGHKTRISPGSVTPVRDMKGLEPMFISGDPRITNEILTEMQMQVRDVFYLDVLELKQSPESTATEIQARMRQMHQALSAPFTRLKDELLTPLLYRTHMILARKGLLLPPFNEAFLDRWNPPVYRGPVARAQRVAELDAISQFLSVYGLLAQTDPALPQALKPWDMLKDVALKLDLDFNRYLLPAEEAKARMQEQEQQAAAQAAVEQAVGMTRADEQAARAQSLRQVA